MESFKYTRKKIFQPPCIPKKELLKQSYFKKLKLGENHLFLNFNYIKNYSNIRQELLIL